MNTSLKTDLRVAAIGTTIYGVYITGYLLVHALGLAEPYSWSAIKDIVSLSANWLLLGAAFIVCYGCGLRKILPAMNKPMRIYTLIIGFAFCLSMVYALIERILFNDFSYYGCYPETWWRIVLIVSSIVWLWLFSSSKKEQTMSVRAAKTIMVVPTIILGSAFLVQVIAGVYVLVIGHVFGFHTWIVLSWLRYLVPSFIVLTLLTISKKQ